MEVVVTMLRTMEVVSTYRKLLGKYKSKTWQMNVIKYNDV
jgi:hypothetical protein